MARGQGLEIVKAYDAAIHQTLVQGFKKQKDLVYAGLSCEGAQTDAMVKLIIPKKPTPISLNMRNSQFTTNAFKYLTNSIENDKCYI